MNTDGNDEDGDIVIGGEEPSDSSTDTMQPSDESSENQNTGTSDGDTSGISTDDSVIDIGNEDLSGSSRLTVRQILRQIQMVRMTTQM